MIGSSGQQSASRSACGLVAACLTMLTLGSLRVARADEPAAHIVIRTECRDGHRVSLLRDELRAIGFTTEVRPGFDPVGESSLAPDGAPIVDLHLDHRCAATLRAGEREHRDERALPPDAWAVHVAELAHAVAVAASSATRDSARVEPPGARDPASERSDRATPPIEGHPESASDGPADETAPDEATDDIIDSGEVDALDRGAIAPAAILPFVASRRRRPLATEGPFAGWLGTGMTVPFPAPFARPHIAAGAGYRLGRYLGAVGGFEGTLGSSNLGIGGIDADIGYFAYHLSLRIHALPAHARVTFNVDVGAGGLRTRADGRSSLPFENVRVANHTGIGRVEAALGIRATSSVAVEFASFVAASGPRTVVGVEGVGTAEISDYLLGLSVRARLNTLGF